MARAKQAKCKICGDIVKSDDGMLAFVCVDHLIQHYFEDVK